MTDELTMRRLLEARGMLLDGLTSLRNMVQLVGSVRVGPKSLINVLPDAVASSEALVSACEQYRKAAIELSGEIKHVKACDDLTRFIAREVLHVAEELRTVGGSLTAGRRLKLEQTLGHRAALLSSAFGLIELLSHALVARQGPTDLREVLGQACQTETTAHGMRDPFGARQRLRVNLVIPQAPVVVHTNTRVVLALISFGAGLLARQNESLGRLSLGEKNGHAVLELSRCQELPTDSGELAFITAIPWLKVTLPSLKLAAELVRAEIETDSDSCGVRMAWPMFAALGENGEALTSGEGA